jgi:ABC-type bacteriocin/lantibiotic exporter with double-glycine peptidase domain
LTLVDTLSFLNIDNDAIRLPSSEIELLPERFMASLKEENKIPRLSFIEKKGKEYIQMQDKTTFIMSQQEIGARWESIVLLVEKSEVERTKSNNKLSWLFALSFLITFTLVLFGLEGACKPNYFFYFVY